MSDKESKPKNKVTSIFNRGCMHIQNDREKQGEEEEKLTLLTITKQLKAPAAQVHGPGASQFFGHGVPEKSIVVMGDRNLSNEAAISSKEVGT